MLPNIIKRQTDKYIKNLSFSLAEQSFRILANFVVSIFLVKYLGPEDFGYYSYVITLATIGFVVARFGLNDIVIKLVSSSVSKKEEESVLLNALILKFSISLITFILTIAISYHFLDDTLYFLVCISIFGVIFQSSDVIEFYFHAKVNIKKIALLKNLQVLFSIFSKIILIYFKFDLFSFICLFFVEVFLLSILYFFIIYSNISDISFSSLNNKLMYKMFSISWPVALANVAMVGYVKIDQIMISVLIDFESVGMYAAATKLSEAWFFVPTLIATTMFPKIIKSKLISINEYNKSLESLFRVQIILAISVALLFSFLSHFIIIYAYGLEYKIAAEILIIHVWSGIFISINRVSVKWFINENLEVVFMLKSIFGFTLNLLLNVIFINKFGIIGAAYATLLSLIIIEYLVYIFVPRTRVLFLIITKSVCRSYFV